MYFKKLLLLTTFILLGVASILAQEGNGIAEKKDDTKETAKVNLPKKEVDGIQIAETSILVYSGLRGRQGIEQIRKTTVEIGELTLSDSAGRNTRVNYERRILRGENLGVEKVRLDQKFPNVEYAMIYDGTTVFGLINNAVFSPRDDAIKSFQDIIWHGLDALLRYKENGSKVELEKEEKELGVDFYVLKLTDKQERVTNYYISKKSGRVMKLEYESDGNKYQRKFYDHNYAQGTLVPYRSVLKSNDKQVEEQKISTITFGQSLGEGLFGGNKL